MAEFLDEFKRRTKKLKRVRFQIPGTKTSAKLNNLASYPVRDYQREAFKAFMDQIIEPRSLWNAELGRYVTHMERRDMAMSSFDRDREAGLLN